jgi:DNA-binding Lrp family transcriptional regulator
VRRSVSHCRIVSARSAPSAMSIHGLRRSLERVPEVVGAATVSGNADALVHMLASDVKQLERALERIRDEPNVHHTRSVIVLSRLIDRPRT